MGGPELSPRRQRQHDNSYAILDSLWGYAGAVPVLGEIAGAAEASYHTGSAIYDGMHGDRDGAINHGVQAAYNGISAIPGVNELLSPVDIAANTLMLGARGAEAGPGLEVGHADQVPGGMADLLGSGAVVATNAIFGADDDNWIADGDQPTGTRGGEVGAGTGFMLGGLPGLLWPEELGSLVNLEEADGVQLYDEDAPTSGARGPKGEANGWEQQLGDQLHDRFIPAMQDARSGLHDYFGGVPAQVMSDAAHQGVDRGQAAANGALRSGNQAIDQGQASVRSAMNQGNRTVDRGQATVNRGVNTAQRGVDSAQSTANSAMRTGNNAIDAAQRALPLPGVANRAIDLGQRAAGGAASMANRAVDTGQRALGGAASLANRAVDGGQRIAGGAANLANHAVDGAQSVARTGLRGARAAADTLWGWMSD